MFAKRGMLLLSVIMYYSDIITDILVAKDLSDSGSEYFGVSVGIILFSVLGSTCLQLFSRRAVNEMNEVGRSRHRLKRVCARFVATFLFTLSQLPYLTMVILTLQNDYYSGNTEYNEDGAQSSLIELKLMEALLESGPEALFQLFILLHTFEEHTRFSLLKYYASISISLLNLVYVMVNYEIKNHTWQYDIFQREFKQPMASAYPRTLSMVSPYVGVLFAYRFAEIFSRIGLLACLGHVYNGYYVFYAIAIDFACINVLNYLKFCLRVSVEERIYTESEAIEDWSTVTYARDRFTTKDSYYRVFLEHVSAYTIQRQWRRRRGELATHFKNRITVETCFDLSERGWRRVRGWLMPSEMLVQIESTQRAFAQEYEDEFVKFKATIQGTRAPDVTGQILSKFVPQLLKNIKHVGLHADYFLYDAVKREYMRMFQEQYAMETAGVPDRDRWWNYAHVHFVVKLATGLAISCVLLVRDVDENGDLFRSVAIGSVVCYFLQMPLLMIVRQWTRGTDPRVFLPWYASPEPETATLEYDVPL